MQARSVTSRTLALVASGVLVVAAFTPWTADGRVAVDLRIGSAGPLSLGLLLLAVAAVPAFGAVFGHRSLPQLLGAVLSGTVVLVWLGVGPTAALAPGVVLAMAATVLWLHGAAFSRR